MTAPVEQFKAALHARGIIPPAEIVADGRIRRCDAEGRNGKNDASYLLHLDGLPAGGFENFRDGLGWQNWRADGDFQQADPALIEARRREREQADAKRKAEARKSAARIWAGSEPCTQHAYLTKKGVSAHGTRVTGDALVVPVRDADGELMTLQFISPDGDKRFLPGGQTRGGFCLIGEAGNTICIGEGVATGATIHEATGLPVAVSFNAGNLMHVAKALRQKFPDAALILCADDDYRTAGNPGIACATEAAQSVGGRLAVPVFDGERPENVTDFNDMAALHGLDAVNRAIRAAKPVSGAIPHPTEKNATAAALTGQDAGQDETSPALIKSGVAGVAGVQANNDELSADTPQGLHGVSGVAEIPGPDARPCFRVFDTFHEVNGARYRAGVWFFGIKAGKNDAPPALTETRVCSPLHIDAVTSDGRDNNFGRLLRFRNTLGRWRTWAMPMELLRGSGDELRGELLAAGVDIDPTARTLLANYLQSVTPARRMRCALQVGWNGDSFVLPDAVIGEDAEGVIFQSGERAHDEHGTAGTLDAWRAEISALAVGNPLLTLALAAAFAGPMLARCHVEGGGLHFVGESSTGKSTLLNAGCSVWGGEGYRRSWRATANGLEGAAQLFNDSLLALDEISECEPRDIGAIVYALGNGRGKQRALRTGGARPVARWRCFVLSNGERTIATSMAEGGFRAKAGQGVRLLDIPAARVHGAWDDLREHQNGAAFADAIKLAAARNYGHAGRAFLERLTRDKRDFCALLERFRNLPAFSVPDGGGQEKRAAGRFALLALAGEAATDYGVTGWPEGAATEAAAECFRVWRAARGRGNDERRQIMERLSAFIERHGDARFSAIDAKGLPVRDRAGWWRDVDGDREFLFTADGMREALRGFDFSRALDTLQEAGALPAPGADGKRARFFRIDAHGVRLYPVNTNKLEADNGT